MSLGIVQVRFGDLKVGHKFMAKLPGEDVNSQFIKKWPNSALKVKSTLMYKFEDWEMVLVWRWR